MTVYLDEIFLVNLCMDWLVVWLTANLTAESSRWQRLFLAAVLGAVYSVMLFFPWGKGFASLPGKMACSCLMIWIVFGFGSWQRYLKCLVYLYLVSFVLGGACMALMYLFGQKAVQTWNGIAVAQIDFQLFWLVAAVFAVVTVVFFLRQQLRRDVASMPVIWTAQISMGQRQVSLRLLVDTGNHLIDPLNAQPVIVAEQNSLLSLFSENLKSLLQQSAASNTERFLQLAEQPELAGRLRLIPYRALGQQGMLLGVRPDFILLQRDGQQKQYTNVIVALSDQKFSPYDAYQGLVQPELL